MASIHSSGEALKLEINFSFGKVTPLKTSKPPLQYVNTTTAGLQRLISYIFEKINLDTQLTVVKARPFSEKRNFSGVNSSSLEFIYTLKTKLGWWGANGARCEHIALSLKNLDFPGGKESACQCRRCRRRGFDPWVRKILWRGNDNPL